MAAILFRFNGQTGILPFVDSDADGLCNLSEYILGTDPSVVDPDSDHDGVPDALETEFGTDPANPSTGGSGLPDGWLVENGLDPLAATAESDEDEGQGDGLTLMEEFEFGTDPNLRDSDDDGVVDGIDGYALTQYLSPPRVPESRYAAIDLHELGLPADAVPVFLDRNGDIFYSPPAESGRQILLHFEISTGTSQTIFDVTGTGLVFYCMSDAGWIAWEGFPSSSSQSGLFRWKKSAATETMMPLFEGLDGTENQQVPNQLRYININDSGTVVGVNHCIGSSHVEGWGLWVSSRHAFLWPQGSSTGTRIGGTYKTVSVSAPPPGEGPPRPSSWPPDGTSGEYFTPLTVSTSPLRMLGYISSVAGNSSTSLFEASNFSDLPNGTSVGAISADGELTTGDGAFAQASDGWQTHPLTVWDPAQKKTRADFQAGLKYHAQGLIEEWIPNPDISSPVTYILSRNKLLRNGRAMPLQNLLSSNATIGTPININSSGAMLTSDGEMLVRVDLAVDANRDGVIKFAGNFQSTQGKPTDKTTEAKPFRFWCNDDFDSGDADSPDAASSNTGDLKVNCKRDLEDYARLHINIGGLQDAIVNGDIQVGLEWRNTTGSPSIKICRAVEPDGGNEYIQGGADGNENWADSQILLQNASLLGPIGSDGGFKFPASFWQSGSYGLPALSADHPNRYLLFDGITEGKGELVLTFWKGTTKIGEGGGVWLDIKNIKKMYERYKASPEGIATPYTNSSGQFNNASTPQNNEMGQTFDKPSDETKDCLVFVHGWNNSFNDSINTAETMFKRLWWQGFKGHFVAFRWETLTQTDLAPAGEYNRSDSRAFIYGAALKETASTLSEQYTVSVVAHSMGNIVTGEAMQEGMQIRNYIMMQAAVPASCYDPNAATLARLVDKDAQVPTPDLHDPTLGYRGYLQSISGTITRYYNPFDYALATGYTVILGIPAIESNWEANQLSYKPDGAYGTQGWQYGYNPSNTLSKRGWLLNDGFHVSPPVFGTTFPDYRYRLVNDSFEMKAFIARSRTKAVGAIDSVGSPIGASVNLQDRYGFGSSRPDHSGQFTRRIQQVFGLYKEIHTISKE